jgi:ubiquitin-conjugating enzyme E2 Q
MAMSCLWGRVCNDTVVQENYPRTPPVWFSESDEPAVTQTLEELTDSIADSSILAQVHHLVARLCDFYNLTAPSELTRIQPTGATDDVCTSLCDRDVLERHLQKDEGQGSDMESGDEDDMMYHMEEDPYVIPSKVARSLSLRSTFFRFFAQVKK